MTTKAVAAAFALLLAPALSGCVVIAADTDGRDNVDVRVSTPRSAPFEALYGAQFDERGFSARLESGGCTSKDNVEARVDRDGARPRIAVVRLKPDECRHIMREGVWLTWSYEELGLDKGQIYELRNALRPW